MYERGYIKGVHVVCPIEIVGRNFQKVWHLAKSIALEWM